MSKHEEMHIFDMFAMVFLIVGALNWGMVGLLNMNLVDMLLGAGSMLGKVVYGLVGLAGLYGLYIFGKMVLMMGKN